jgi:hypothetical protein
LLGTLEKISLLTEFKFTKRLTPQYKIIRYKTGTTLDTILVKHQLKFFLDKNQN